MKKLKSILQSKYFYIALFLLLITILIPTTNQNHKCNYNIDEDQFRIVKITNKDYGLKLILKGKEKIIANIFLEQEEKQKFLNTYELNGEIKIKTEESKLKHETVENTFDYKDYLNNQNIYHSVNINKIMLISKNKNIFYKIKNNLIKRENNLKSTPYIKSLIFGDNSYLDEEIISSYRTNGISHLFAISGLHIAMFIIIIAKLLKSLRMTEKSQNIILILFLFFYMFLTNFTPSVVRAGVFTILLLINKTLNLNLKTINLLFLTLGIIIIINPLSIYQLGLQYSFVVTLFLIKYKDIINKANNIITKLLITSSIAFLASYPITISNFYEVNFLSIVYNLAFVPFVSYLLLPFTLITYFFTFFDGILIILVRIIESSSQLIEHITFFKISMCKMNMLSILLYYVILCKMLSKKSIRKNFYFFLLATFFIIHYFSPINKENTIEFLDVGQGDATLLNINNNHILIDTGGLVMYSDKEYTYQLTKSKLLPLLKSKGIKKLTLIITHGDTDHMKEAYYLVENFKVDQVIFNKNEYNDLEKGLIEKLNKKHIKYQKSKDYLEMDKYKIYFLNTKMYDNENDNSNVIYLNYKGLKVLLMGDAGIKRETDIINKYNLKDIDILKVGHHGSNTSTSKEFIKEINPKISIISVGENNRYGHPKDTVLNNLSNTKIYRTDKNGSIKIKLNKNSYEIKTYNP